MKFITLFITSLFFSSLALANSLESKVDALANELANLKEQLNGTSSQTDGNTHFGMGESASKVYFSKSPLSIGGYGEVVVQNIQGENGDTADALRFVPYFGYRFSDSIILNAEIEIEHADEIFLEFGYLDFLIHEQFNVRAGLVLVPLGITNVKHEPTLFPSVNRAEIEKNIIPTTLRENGAFVYGRVSGFEYHLGVVNSFDAANFSDSSWIRGGRQKGSQAKANDWATVARLDWVGLQNLTFGGSFYTGKASHDTAALGDAKVTLWDAHLLWAYKALQLKALFVEGQLDDADLVSSATGKTVGEKTQGYYVEAQYNILPLIKPESTQKVNVFARFEDYDTHKEVATGFTKSAALARQRTVVGFNYLPHSNVILKTNWVFRDNDAGGEADLWELGLGYIF